MYNIFKVLLQQVFMLLLCFCFDFFDTTKHNKCSSSMKLETKTRRERIIAKGDVSVKQYYMENRGVGFNIN